MNLNGRIRRLEKDSPPDLAALTDEELNALIKALNIPRWMYAESNYQ